jgi:tetratricopeptide (TPR) repeat protein
MGRPLCFVLMPFGKKTDAEGRSIDFDEVYRQVLAPAIERAGLGPIRADEERHGGVIHQQMFERLVYCDYAVADLTAANANVFYELGVRHAALARSTVCVFADGGRLPFDVGPLRALPYKLKDGLPAAVEADAENLTKLLRDARDSDADSPVYNFVTGYPERDLSKAATFRECVERSNNLRRELERARGQDAVAVGAVRGMIGDFESVDVGLMTELLLAYRDVRAWAQMIELIGELPEAVAETAFVREQLAFALNRAGRGDEAEAVLNDLIKACRAGSETLGLLGRIYKDRWQAALKQGDALLAAGYLDQAIDAYRRGFQADWRDPYPGINVVSLMEVKDPPDPERKRLIPVVDYAARCRVEVGQPDYWDYATLLELAVLAKKERDAGKWLRAALARQPKSWEMESTAGNLRLVREARERQGQPVAWAKQIEDDLLRRASVGAAEAAKAGG